MTAPEKLPVRAQAEVQRILASRRFSTGCNDNDQAEHLRYAIRHVTLQGLWLEFGVSTGASVQVIAEQTRARIHGFDSFEGLPEDWVRGEGRPTLTRGSFHGSPEAVPPHVTLIPGLFADTLPRFVAKNTDVVAFMHVDCDIYTSTRTVLGWLGDRLVPGTVIVFDELFNYPNFADHEMRALLEAAAEWDLNYEYLGYVNKCFPASSAASLKVTGIGHRPTGAE
ncbi:MAG: class I SAM-dependent methyltransferase [Actinomycetota bacterium]|nr:class I SAM-dependent methyltransferase [Actinomycetota bacterium]